ncbi:MAG: hypothetical protein FJ083_04335 [Cyanobacteria bacterium K_Offshore_surface_m2_239]|nr:hypothetical protein [Cyanobacteria bacterium K_Offshore_surface_m2_239]
MKTALRDPSTFLDARDLMGRLRTRRDLLATVAEEIDEVVAREPMPQRVGSWRRQRPNSVTNFANPKHNWRATAAPVFSGQVNSTTNLLTMADAHKSDDLNLDKEMIPLFSRQKIWLHRILWMPYVNLICGLVSARLMRSTKLLGLWILLILVTAISAISQESSLAVILFGALLGSAGAIYAERRIRQARKCVDSFR